MKPYFKLSLALFLSFLISSCSDLHQLFLEDGDEPVIHTESMHLDAEVRGLLQQEMRAIQSGMMLLVPAIASGDWDKIIKIGKEIQSSYVLKQQLTPEQHHALHRSLSPGFIKRDQAFHNSAGMLAHAAEMEKPELVSFYFYKLSSACAECHAEYAPERFPALVMQHGETHHH